MFDWFKKKKGAAPDCTHGTNLTPEQDIRIAEEEYAAGNLVHAAYHAGCALAVDPTRPEWLAVLNKISDIAPEPLKLAPIEERNYFATMAMRGYLLHRMNRLDEALDILLQAVVVRPEAAYLRWATEWVREPGAAGKLEGGVTRFLLELVNGKLAEWQQTGAGAATLELLPEFIQAVGRSGTRDSHVLFVGASVLRRSGHPTEAFELADGAYRIAPSWEIAVARAYALREMDRPAEAYAAFQKALEHRPDEMSVHLDMGDMMWDQQKWDWALHHYGTVLQKEPQHPWALPSYHAAQFRKTGEERWKSSVQALADQGNDRAKQLAWAVGMDLDTYLPERTEAAINVAEQLIAQFAGRPDFPENVECSISALEPASALLAVRYELQTAGFPRPPSFKIEKLGSPDPRLPYGNVDYVVWRYHGNDPSPGYPPPRPEVYAAISRIAVQPYQLGTWAEWGRGAAQELGAASVEQLLGAMVNPPAAPSGMKAWAWITRFQIAAAFVIGGRETGWANTERRRLLLSLARGPMDWTVEAALIALAMVARDTPEAIPEIAELHLDRYRGMPDHGAVCYLATLSLCALDRPGLQDDERAHWVDVLENVYR